VRTAQSTWTFEQFTSLPALTDLPEAPEWVAGPYAAALRQLKLQGCFDSLPLDTEGKLRVNIPFCAGFREFRTLGDFLADICTGHPHCTGADVYATDVLEKYGYEWALAQRWYSKTYPRMRLQTRPTDLAQAPLPKAGLTVGIHPEVTKGSFWFPIIGSIVRSSSSGVCVLATFFEVEMETLKNMLNMYKSADSVVSVAENSYYDDHEMPASPPLRYLVTLRGDRNA